MASVSAVSATDFRASLAQTQNSAPESDDPFSQLLNSIADVNKGTPRPEAPQASERRADAPAKHAKSETDADRQAKHRAPKPEKPEGNAPAEAAPAANAAKDDQAEDETETSADGEADPDALLMLALADTQQTPAAGPAAGEAEAAVAVTEENIAASPEAAASAPAVAAQTAPVLAAAQTAPAVAADAAEAAAEIAPMQAAQNTASAKAPFEVAPADAEAEAGLAVQKFSAGNPEAAAKPLKTVSPLEVQVQTQPGPVNVNAAAPLHGPAPLEMLNAAISKHAQLAFGIEINEPKPDAQKPLVSSNAIAPNFALTAQVSAPVSAQAQPVAEASRAVPLESLAVEIATRANKGERRFDIRLDPPELGRIDVRLEIDSKGNTTTKLIVERAETLDMLQRDARGLEKALQNAGLKTDAGGLQFSLQQDTQAQHGQQNHVPEARGRPELLETEAEIVTGIAAGNASLAAQLRGGVDIRI